jgi:hypothetical protein
MATTQVWFIEHNDPNVVDLVTNVITGYQLFAQHVGHLMTHQYPNIHERNVHVKKAWMGLPKPEKEQWNACVGGVAVPTVYLLKKSKPQVPFKAQGQTIVVDKPIDDVSFLRRQPQPRSQADPLFVRSQEDIVNIYRQPQPRPQDIFVDQPFSVTRASQ